jgi:uncharacterized protein (DUF608 family)
MPKKLSLPVLSRRDLIKIGSVAAAGSLTVGFQPAMAGPFVAGDFEKLVPADKKLTEAWIRSLYERGEPEWYSREELKHVGMPVGGICCGHVYLSGDGRLWHWDIFNEGIATGTGGPHYAQPMAIKTGIDLGFTIRARVAGKEMIRPLDRIGFPNVRFRGAYPMGFVDYGDDRFPVQVSLEAFSPFAPLEVDDSSLPLTVMRYTVRNTSEQKVDVSLAGQMANPVLQNSGNAGEAEYVNTVSRRKRATCLHYAVEERKPGEGPETRPDVVFEEFESETYENWTVEGTAFGTGPVVASELPSYQGDVGASGKRLVNSHNTRRGEDVAEGDAHIGAMTSQPFKIERRYIHALVGGGSDTEKTALQLLIDDKVVAMLAGRNNNAMQRQTFSVAEHQGETAQLRIVDKGTGGWGNIGVDHIVFSDRPATPPQPLDKRKDMGDMTLAILDHGEGVFAAAEVPDDGEDTLFTLGHKLARSCSSVRPKGAVGKTISLAPGEEATVSFAVAWRFPNSVAPVGKGHYYAERFASSLAAMDHLADRYDELYARTRLWHETWYDSTLPYWLLDRTFVNTSTLATSTCLRVEGGRFWGWEGVGCCAGTCSHVWHYAQAVGRVFPELERIVRERVDYGLAFQPNGQIFYRAEFGKHEAIDGQCGTILRVYREHTMSPNDEFLRRIWPQVKTSIQYLIKQDGDANGMLEGKQFNTLDAAWYGPISWLSSLYISALRAGAAMAREMEDGSFARECDTLAERGGQWMSENLFNGEYFYQQRDPAHPEAFGAGIGCHIDQVFGQGWAHQLGLGRVLPKDKTESALRSLWRYNFAPDVAPYREQYTTGRWYAMPGEAGLIMCTFPKGGEQEARGGKPTHGFAGYFNECMNGFEYQAAGHMIAEGLVQEGLAVTRAIHDRYHPSRRNPYNEIECGDHYARSMASYGVHVSVSGFEYHGPKRHLGFAPKLTPKNFRAAFIAAEGWGRGTQTIEGRQQEVTLDLKKGLLRLRTLALEKPADLNPGKALVGVGNRSAEAKLQVEGNQVTITFAEELLIRAGEQVRVTLS